MKRSSGTPKRLRQAIMNGIRDFEDDAKQSSILNLSKRIEAHVADFIRNRLGPIRMNNNNDDVEKYISLFVESLK